MRKDKLPVASGLLEEPNHKRLITQQFKDLLEFLPLRPSEQLKDGRFGIANAAVQRGDFAQPYLPVDRGARGNGVSDHFNLVPQGQEIRGELAVGDLSPRSYRVEVVTIGGTEADVGT